MSMENEPVFVRFPDRKYIDMRKNLTLEGVEDAVKAGMELAIIPVVGNCLEGAGVVEDGYAVVCFNRMPRPHVLRKKAGERIFDLCLCYTTFPGTYRPEVMLKAYVGVWSGFHMVGTRYRDMRTGGNSRIDCCMKAEKIFGVVIASYDQEGTLIWAKHPSEFPEGLENQPTIWGEVSGI